MSQEALQEAYATLKVARDANLATIESAYDQLKKLFNGNSMACYSLCSEAEQQVSLKVVESAHQLIISEYCSQPTTAKAEPARTSECCIEAVIPDQDISPGSFLREQRQKLDISLATIAEQTKISRTILGHIEDEAYTQLPAPVYLRGFILEFSKIVRAADPHQIANQYLEQMRREAC